MTTFLSNRAIYETVIRDAVPAARCCLVKTGLKYKKYGFQARFLDILRSPVLE